MGRITVFSLADCPHCKKAKTLLGAKGWDYLDISLSDYPEMRSSMLQLANQLTVPQIFFNERHLGGAAQLVELAERQELDGLYAEMLAGDDPLDERLDKPSRPIEPTPPDPPPPSDPRVEVGDQAGTVATFAEVEAALAIELPIGRATRGCFAYRRCFSGADAVTGLARHYTLPSREAAAQLGSRLLDLGVLVPVAVRAGAVSFTDSPRSLYQLRVHSSPLVLNARRDWASPSLSQPALAVAKRLKKQLGRALSASTSVLSSEQGKVDYASAASSDEYAAFQIAV
eukprot:COSAG05_NODE_4412_length_1526_cov_1.617379_1_plen_284_part_01